MWANNEVGTVQPVKDVVAVAGTHGIPVHTDAVQALSQVPVDFAASGVDAMTVTAHKVGGPYGVGALIVRRDLDLVPLLHGGGQERDIRSGTIDASTWSASVVIFDTVTALDPARAARRSRGSSRGPFSFRRGSRTS